MSRPSPRVGGVLRERPRSRPRRAAYSAINSFLSLALIGVAALLSGEPLLFPSLGPTAFLLFAAPLTPAACPRNTLVGHLVGVLSGAFALLVTGLHDQPPDLNHVTGARMAAAAIALGLTCGLMPLLDRAHPPAGATTLIVALGLLRTPEQLVMVMVGVILITAQGVVINRLAGIRYPWWSPAPAP
ncbi:HPP family protein [Streptoalloteichus hindustanus]|uniref:HPP family protein n=1 Tax=Streptoalloteichus hindustanus TaxID=2017 RepID=A0A1M5F236_STRHI|nr:HPP family protein [Streptoalloteichus hindustanus]SHF85517.1 HPP family protein [Streptoalloteichus hindustanus]